jgi:hypothetical protein
MTKKEKTTSYTSPKGGNKGCLCEDGTYKKKCCDGSLQAQGVGSESNQATSTVTNTNQVRVITRVAG